MIMMTTMRMTSRRILSWATTRVQSSTPRRSSSMERQRLSFHRSILPSSEAQSLRHSSWIQWRALEVINLQWEVGTWVIRWLQFKTRTPFLEPSLSLASTRRCLARVQITIMLSTKLHWLTNQVIWVRWSYNLEISNEILMRKSKCIMNQWITGLSRRLTIILMKASRQSIQMTHAQVISIRYQSQVVFLSSLQSRIKEGHSHLHSLSL